MKLIETHGKSNPDCGPIVFSSGLTYGDRNPAARLVGVENYNDITLWLDESRLPARGRAAVEQAGLLAPNNPCSPLPEAAYSATMHASVSAPASDNAAARVVDLAVQHDGAGAPWLQSLGKLRSDRYGQVDIIETVVDQHQRAVYERSLPLPRTVMPGDSVHVHANLAPPGALALRAGTAYTVRFALVQQGVRAFGGPDGQGVVETLQT